MQRYRPEVERWLRSKHVRPWEIDDAVADTFAKVWTGRQIDVPSLRDPKNVKNVLFKAAEMVVPEVFEKRKRANKFERFGTHEGRDPPATHDLQIDAERSEIRGALAQELANLAPEMRETMMLKNEGYKYEEIALQRGVSVNTVKESLKSAYKIVRKSMRSAGFGDEAGQDKKTKKSERSSTNSPEREK